SVLPIVAVNVASYENLLNQRETTIAGAGALLGGIALGGATAGVLGTRTRRGASVSGAVAAGGVAAALYSATLLGLMMGASRLDLTPPLITVAPLRVTLAIVFLAALLLLTAITAGSLVSRRARPAAHLAAAHLAAAHLAAARRPLVDQRVPLGAPRLPTPSRASVPPQDRPPGPPRRPAPPPPSSRQQSERYPPQPRSVPPPPDGRSSLPVRRPASYSDRRGDTRR
ncbi:MAG: hypothetical protein IVW57_05800, partial [Ktedonobacterales bacterium]|nr:hypothetical protein [Ktedonobacterales bacterium]